MLDSAIAALPTSYEQVIRLRLVKKLSHQEVGTILGISEDAARQLLCRALVELGKRLKARDVLGPLMV